MSKMKDQWGDTITVRTTPDSAAVVTFASYRGTVDMELDAKKLRKFIKKLNKTLAEVEDM